MANGVSFTDPASTWLDTTVQIGADTSIEPFTILRGQTSIGVDCWIGPFTQITDSEIGDRCRIDHSWLKQCKLGDGSDCGPFVKLRPQTEIAAGVHIGSFAEIVRTKIGSRSRVPHLSYLGDAVIGENVNIGAGTVTANFDGVAKHQTRIEDDVFVGVDTLLRAPVKLGRASKTGAGSVVLDDVAPGKTVAGVPAREIRKKR
jgi:bifunctional UDP-N-acetylglucosamine pyrophosphorylase/glucosamine-1-phosphate N-acetyltransferase